MATRGSKLELDVNVGQWNSCLGATEHKGCECSLFWSIEPLSNIISLIKIDGRQLIKSKRNKLFLINYL